MFARLGALLLLLLVSVGWSAVADPAFTDAELAKIRSLSLKSLPPLPPDPSNPAIDNPDAMALGATLFFDTRLSKNGKVACSTCHQIDNQFQDGLPLGKGIGTMNRRTQPLAGVAWQSSFFWDGRKDSLWSQALAPLENAVEHGGNRAAYAHFMAREFKARYELVFGPMPDLTGVPDNAGPLGSTEEQAAWAAMSETQRLAVNTVFANIGKMIAAFERSLTVPETRFDRFANALVERDTSDFTAKEIEGLKLFTGKGGCISCHSGPRITDDEFHNTGVPAGQGLPVDLGRLSGMRQLAADEFNCRVVFSAPDIEACPTLPTSAVSPIGAFKTPSLRGVVSRPPYMHAGQFASLDAVLNHYARAPTARAGASEIKPFLLTSKERAALIAFLETLEPL